MGYARPGCRSSVPATVCGLRHEWSQPSLLAPLSGCVFRTRCSIVREAYAGEAAAMQAVGRDHIAACPYGELFGAREIR